MLIQNNSTGDPCTTSSTSSASSPSSCSCSPSWVTRSFSRETRKISHNHGATHAAHTILHRLRPRQVDHPPGRKQATAAKLQNQARSHCYGRTMARKRLGPHAAPLVGKGDFDEIWAFVADWRPYPGIARDLSDLSLNHRDCTAAADERIIGMAGWLLPPPSPRRLLIAVGDEYPQPEVRTMQFTCSAAEIAAFPYLKIARFLCTVSLAGQITRPMLSWRKRRASPPRSRVFSGSSSNPLSHGLAGHRS